MHKHLVFQEKKEIERLRVQNELLADYEIPVIDTLFAGRSDIAVLDIGCNDGAKTVEIFDSEEVSRVVGLEYNADLAAMAQEKYGDEKFMFYQLDVEEEDFSASLEELMKKNDIKGFDMIYLSFVLMHLTDIRPLLCILKDFLKEDGKLFIVEADDKISTLSNDYDGLLKRFLHILSADRYSGNREVGGCICDVLRNCGYDDIHVWHDRITAGEGEETKKKAIYETFFSYLPEDVELLRQLEPEDERYISWSDWIARNYEKLRALIMQQESEISMGMKILSCGKGTDTDLHFCPLTITDVEETRQLCDACVGKNLYTENEIRDAIDDNEKFFYLLKDAKGRIAGYIYYYLTDEESIASYAKLRVEQFQSVYDGKKKVGKIQSVGISEEYRGCGLAEKMIEFVRKQLKCMEVEAVFIVCWKPMGRVALRSALEANGFMHLSEAKKVWYDDKKLVCPYCKGRCVCDAEIYYGLIDYGRTYV